MGQRHDSAVVPLAHIGSVTQLLAQARRHAIAPERLFDRALIAALRDGNVPDYVPAIAVIDALETAAQLADNPTFGLETSAYADLQGFGPLSKLTGELISVADALRQSARYMHLVNGALATRIDRFDDVVRIERACVLPGTHGNRQLMDGAMVLLLRAMRAILGEGWAPQRVELGHAGTPRRDVYARLLRAPLVFGADSYAIELSAADFARTVPLRLPAQRLAHDRTLAVMAHRFPGAVTMRVRQKVREQLARGTISLTATATSLGVPPRSLQRMLRAQGSDFSSIVREQRVAIAQECLGLTLPPNLTDLAGRLAFQDISVASRFLRAQFGASVRRLRRARPDQA